jgi:hypothetical protein
MNAKVMAAVCSLHSEARFYVVFCGGVPVRHKLFAMLVSIVLVAIAPFALAEHEPNHRYTVSGYVLNEDESPIPSTTVLISANGIGARGTTDTDGYFSLRLHLHDADLGRKLQIKTDHGEGTISATFDPGDLSSARVHHVNIIGGRLIEGKLNGGGKVPVWVFYLLGLSLLIIVVPVLGKSIKRLKKRLHPTAKPGPKKKPGSSKARPKSKKHKRR